jgi:CheY-like chemotaxis protein
MQSKQKKILVVDDELDILAFLQELLEGEGYTVVTSDKPKYVEMPHDGGLPDLILMDVLLFRQDGRDVVKHLKSQEETRHIPVIMFSAHPKAENTARAAGADDFIEKPFEMSDLLAKVAYYLTSCS